MYQLSSWNQYKGWSFFFVQGNRTQAIIQISTITQQKHGTKHKFHFYPFENFYNVEITYVGETGEQAELNTPFIIKSANWITLLDES